jgi:hypothetical protein
MFSANHLRALFASLDDGISPLFSGQTKGRITSRKWREVKKIKARKRKQKGKERKRTRKQQELVRLLSRSLN